MEVKLKFKMMKIKENKTKTIQVRLTETDYEYLKQAAYTMGTDASKLVRQMVQISINAAKEAEKMKQEKLNKPISDNASESGVVVNEDN